VAPSASLATPGPAGGAACTCTGWWCSRTARSGVGNALLMYVENDVAGSTRRILLVETGSLPAFERTRKFYLRRNYQQLPW